MHRLEIGPGPKPLGPEWKTLNCVAPADYVVDLAAAETLLTYVGSDRFDLVFASHVIEHVPWFQTVDVLENIRAIMNPGGKLEIWVPNWDVIVRAYFDDEAADAWWKHNPDKDLMTWVNGRVFTYGPEPNWHRAVFNESHLRNCLAKAGFDRIKRLLPHERKLGVSHGAIDLGMEAYKP